MDSQSEAELIRQAIASCERAIALLQEEIDASESSTVALPATDGLLSSTTQIEEPYVNDVDLVVHGTSPPREVLLTQMGSDGLRQLQRPSTSLFTAPKCGGNLTEASRIPYDLWLPTERRQPPSFDGRDSQHAWNQQLRRNNSMSPRLPPPPKPPDRSFQKTTMEFQVSWDLTTPPPPPKSPDANHRAVDTIVLLSVVAIAGCPLPVWENVCVNGMQLSVELSTVSDYLDFKEVLVNGMSNDICVLEFDFEPGMFRNNNSLAPLLDLLPPHTHKSLTLMLNDRIYSISKLQSELVKVKEFKPMVHYVRLISHHMCNLESHSCEIQFLSKKDQFIEANSHRDQMQRLRLCPNSLDISSTLKSSTGFHDKLGVVSIFSAGTGSSLFGYDTEVISRAILYFRNDFKVVHIQTLLQEAIVSMILVGTILSVEVGRMINAQFGRKVAVVMTNAKVSCAIMLCATGLMLVHIISYLLSVETCELFLKNKFEGLAKEMGLVLTQEETGWRVRMLTHEIRTSLTRHTILKITLVELCRILGLEEYVHTRDQLIEKNIALDLALSGCSNMSKLEFLYSRICGNFCFHLHASNLEGVIILGVIDPVIWLESESFQADGVQLIGVYVRVNDSASKNSTILQDNASEYQTLSDVLCHAPFIHANELSDAKALIDGKLVIINEACSTEGVHKVALLFPILKGSFVQACIPRDIFGILSFSGLLYYFAYLNSKELISQATFAIMGDIITSLQQNLDALCDVAELIQVVPKQQMLSFSVRIGKGQQWDPGGQLYPSPAARFSPFKQWDPGKSVQGGNFYNLEDKVVFNGGSNVMNENNPTTGIIESVRVRGQLANESGQMEGDPNYQETNVM